jgi:hypothetical protein
MANQGDNMHDLATALRESGHTEIAAALERKALAGDLREAGRSDLADALEAGEPAAEAPEPSPPTPPAPHEQPAQQLNAAQSKWLTLGAPGGSDDGKAA